MVARTVLLAFGKKLFDDIGGKQLAVPDVHQHFVDALLSQFVYALNQDRRIVHIWQTSCRADAARDRADPVERLRFFRTCSLRIKCRIFAFADDVLTNEPVFGRFWFEDW